MKMSKRAKRMQRHHQRNSRVPGLNLVSLMDIFTILVFFLLVNSSDGQVLPTSKNVKLPESLAEVPPRYNLVVTISNNNVIIDGKSIASISDDSNNIIEGLTAQLQSHLQKLTPDQHNPSAVQEVTIMGDRNLPYRTLKQVMTSCTVAGFERISFAVLQKSPGSQSQ